MLPTQWRLGSHAWLQPLLVLSAMAWLYVWKLRHRWRPVEQLRGKVVVVTGASSGLGEALVHRFFAAGCRLILMSRDQERLERVRQDVMLSHQCDPMYPPVVVPLDLSDSESASSAASRALQVYGHVDVLVNNAGISFRGEALLTALQVDGRLMQVNYLGQLAVIKAVLPAMVRRRSGHVLCISSVQGRLAVPYRSAYAASKHALQAFCDCLRAEVADHGVLVTVVSPSYICTNLSRNAVTASGATYGKLDASTASGMEPSVAAGHVLDALLQAREETLLSPLRDRLAVLLRALLPTLFFLLMRRRARSGVGRPG